MRLKLIHSDHQTRLVVAETGERIDGVVAARFERQSYLDNAELTVTVNDCEAEIEVGSGPAAQPTAGPFSEAERRTRLDAIDRIMFFASRIAGSPVACDKEKGGAYLTKDLLALADRLQQVDARTPQGG
jgi:hypothetical protein